MKKFRIALLGLVGVFIFAFTTKDTATGYEIGDVATDFSLKNVSL